MDVDLLPVISRKILIYKSDSAMAKLYQISGQQLKFNAVRHVLLAFLGIFRLLSLFANHCMSLSMQINQLSMIIWR
jgi:hypothetical protein